MRVLNPGLPDYTPALRTLVLADAATFFSIRRSCSLSVIFTFVLFRVPAKTMRFSPFFETGRLRGGGWQRGQKWLLLPATIVRRMIALQREHDFPWR